MVKVTMHSEPIWGVMLSWVTLGHLRVTVGHLRATVGRPRAVTIVYFISYDLLPI